MQRYRYEIDNVRAHLRSLWAVIGLQLIIILALWFGWSQAPKQLRVHVPPDLRSGAVLAAEEVPPANVYAFAFYINSDYEEACGRDHSIQIPDYTVEFIDQWMHRIKLCR